VTRELLPVNYYQVRTPVTAERANTYAIRELARLLLTSQITALTRHLRRLLDDHAPQLMNVYGAGPDTVAQLLITAGDNPARLRSERHFAALAGVCLRGNDMQEVGRRCVQCRSTHSMNKLP
jgi:transposase